MIFAVGLIGATTAPTFADGIDPSGLVRYGEQNGVSYEDWVSTEPVSTVTVKKIEAGKVRYVTITQTATGTYSTDGFESAHVQYPGVTKPSNPRNEFTFSSWSHGSWHRISAYNGNSYVSVSTYKTHRGPARTATCVSTISWAC
ncbi:hypothetical protein VW35_17240 [Devosia soli]|uniref:Uncharacterized protein n=1 Tax=Devosia soli TaxID=361041 RepID=A0A0F5L2V5_9HYPH|nr:hypothetical protein [Devosia soli]KKB76530.1 hypothetical protein VW35_17240 [Devosia soli]